MSDLFNSMTFDEAFKHYIKGRTVIGTGFRQPDPVELSNGYQAYPCGYFTLYDNGFKVIVHGSKLVEHTSLQEIWVLDEQNRPVGYKDQEFIEYN